MSPAPENPPVQPDDLLLFSLISAEFDGELFPEEVGELRKLERLFPDRANAFRDQCAQLREKLQQLPVIPTELRTELTAARPSTTRQASFPPRSEFSQVIPHTVSLRPALRRTIPVVTTLLVCVLCVILLRPHFPDRSPAARSSSLADARLSSASREARASVAMRAPSAPAASTSPIAAASPAATADTASPFIGELQPLLTETDWQVVVVRVRSGGPDDVLKELREILARHGLTLARSQPVTMPEWLGVFLPASIPQRKSLLDEVQQGLVVDAPEWDPAEIMRSSRESILQAVRQSLASPTRSELAGGEVFVAVSPAIASEDPGQVPSQKQTPVPKERGLSAMLLVFEFSQGAGDAGQRRIF